MSQFRGITLIEMMITILLGSFIISGVTIIYLATQKNLLVQTALITIQENNQIAMQILSSAIKSAGFLGCAKLTKDFPIIQHTQYHFSPENRMTGEYTLKGNVNFDEITIKKAAILSAVLLDDIHNSQKMAVNPQPLFKSGDILIISDCQSAEIFIAREVIKINASVQMIIPRQPLHKLYKKYSEVRKFESDTYYISTTSRLDDKGKMIYALYRKDIYTRKTELIEGIESMRILYSVLDQDGLTERNANEVDFWSNIVGVSIELKLSSLNNYPLQKKQYIYAALPS